MVTERADIVSDSMARSRRRYTTGTRRELTPAIVGRIRSRLEELGQGPRWLEVKADLAKGAATKILDGNQQTTNHLDAIFNALGISATVIDDPDELKLIEDYRAITDPHAREHARRTLELHARKDGRSGS